jgi:hypothetical protein
MARTKGSKNKVKRTRNTLGKRKVVTGQTRTQAGFKTLDCIMCREAVKVDKDTKAVLCGRCTMLASGAPAPKSAPKKTAVIENDSRTGLPVFKGYVTEGKAPKLNKDGTPRKKRSPNGTVAKKVSSGRPRGWHLKKRFVDTDGTVYKFGVSTGKKTVEARKNEAKQRKMAKSASKYVETLKPTAAPKKRGRPKGSKNKPKRVTKRARKTSTRKTTKRRSR